MEKRKFDRFETKLYAKMSSGSKTSWGLLTDVSEKGLFIMNNRDFAMGEIINIEIFMPDNNSSILKGIVRRRVELPDSIRKHGIGIEIMEKDIFYRRLLKIYNMQISRLNPGSQTKINVT